MWSIKMQTAKSEAEISVGKSKFWGGPDLPSSLEYPSLEREDDDEDYEAPFLDFVCQINCEEVHPFDKENLLPEKGMLYFFAQLGYWLRDDEPVFRLGKIPSSAVKVLYYPENDAENFTRILWEDEDGVPYAPHEELIHFSSCDEASEGVQYDHKLLGAPYDMDFRVLESMKEGALLFQMDSCEGEGFSINFMDCGLLLFLIEKADLQARRFNRIRVRMVSA